jgi:hypothetical protein
LLFLRTMENHRTFSISMLQTNQRRDKMWKDLWEKVGWRSSSAVPKHCLRGNWGDWNLVEDLMDRNSGAAETVPDSFKRLKHLLWFHDRWHVTFPDSHDYTCLQQCKDQISGELHTSYSFMNWQNQCCSQQFKTFRGCETKHCPVKSDHRLVLAQLICHPEEKVSKGWISPQDIKIHEASPSPHSSAVERSRGSN